jgi:hypothetical protein|tara:strand:- start:960 stop:1427 length:468 start_codon:yes stop_codon:yes gene_type:complete
LKRGQVQLQTSILVVFVFLILVMGGMIIYFQIESRNIEAIKYRNIQNEFDYMISSVPSSPELGCSKMGVSEECINVDNARAFRDSDSSSKEMYQDLYGYKKFVLNYTFGEEEIIEMYDYQPSSYGGIRKIVSPVSVYIPRNDSYIIGMFEVYMYE